MLRRPVEHKHLPMLTLSAPIVDSLYTVARNTGRTTTKSIWKFAIHSDKLTRTTMIFDPAVFFTRPIFPIIKWLRLRLT